MENPKEEDIQAKVFEQVCPSIVMLLVELKQVVFFTQPYNFTLSSLCIDVFYPTFESQFPSANVMLTNISCGSVRIPDQKQ